MTALQKIIFWLDEHSRILERVEVLRANWVEQNFELRQWIPNGAILLDVGCGVGDVTHRLAKYAGTLVVGVDITDYRRRGIRKNDFFDFILSDATVLPFKAHSFDRVCVFWTLHHVIEPLEVIRETVRVLKVGGELVILEDTIASDASFRRWLTHIYDRIINLDFDTHPHSNQSIQQWDHLIRSNFAVRTEEVSRKPWFTPFKLLEFGILRYTILKDELAGSSTTASR